MNSEEMDKYTDDLEKGYVPVILDNFTDFIHTEALFYSADEVDYEALGIEGKDEGQWTPFSFRRCDVECFNESDMEDCTTIRMNSSFTIRVKIPYSEFKKLVQ